MKKALSRLLIIGSLALLLGTIVIAQQPQTSNYTADKTLKANARINPSTLAMELSIPLPSYPGRAGTSVNNSLEYSSKVWGSGSPGRFLDSGGHVVTSVYPQYAAQTVAGWMGSAGIPKLDDVPDELYDENGHNYAPLVETGGDPNNTNLYYIKRYRIIMPDGSTHELRVDDAPHSYGTEDSPGYQSGDSKQTGTYLSTDGSRIRLEWTTVGGVVHNTLYMPDGSRYFDLPSWQYGGTGTVIYIDRNGNKMSYDMSAHVWTDTMGRTLQNPIDRFDQTTPQPAATPTFSYPSMDGASTTEDVQLVWGNLDTQQSTLYYLSEYSCNATDTTNIPSGGEKLFTGLNGGDPRVCGLQSPFDPVVLTEVRLPNGAKYKFHYNVYGEIDRIDYPTGGYERFVYAQLPPVTSSGKPGYDQFNRGVVDRYISPDGTSGSEIHWHYAIVRESTYTSTGPYHVQTFAPDGSWSEQLVYEFWTPNDLLSSTYGFESGLAGHPYETRVYDNTTNNTLLRRTLTSFAETGPITVNGLTGNEYATRDTRPDKEISMIFEPGSTNALVTMDETVYDTSGNSDPAYFSSLNVKQSKKYNYVAVSASTAAGATLATAEGWFSSSNLATITDNTYLYDSNYEARNITGLVTQAMVEDAAGSPKAKSQIAYDETGTYPLLTDVSSTHWEDPVSNYRGLATTKTSWYDLTNNLYVQSHVQYDRLGNPRNSWDGKGNLTQTQFSSSYDCAYLTQTTTPIPDPSGTNGSSSAFTSTTVYDYNTGLPTSTTDENGQTTNLSYADPTSGVLDPLLRIRKVTAPNGQQTITEYGTPESDGTYAAADRFVKVKTQIDADNWKQVYTFSDGIGRTIESQTVDTNGDVFVLTGYDNMGRVSTVSNPFRNVSSPVCGSNIDCTTTSYDDVGRATRVTTPDTAHVDTAFSLATTGSQIGTVVTVTDQASKVRRSVTNALGQLIRVDEPTDASGLGTIDTPNQPTYYSYDTLNNLATVNQGVQTRSFVYDSLSRLKQATNPESGTINYTYDANSNLATKTDARNITTTYTYDALNRVTLRQYTNEPSGSETPDVSYFYDNVTNAKGKLTKVSSSVSTTEYTSFDILGHVTASKQTTDGVTYGNGTSDSPMTYTYNLSGALIEQQYPSGRVVKNVLDANGDLSMVESKKNAASGFWSYANSFTYNASEAVTSMQLGNGHWESTVFNSRLQPTQIALGTVPNATDKLKLNYDYGSTSNNGNVQSQTITVPTVGSNTGFVAVQSYSYDSLNRLKDATENVTPTGGSASQSWKQTFSYDRYGNRNFDEANTTTLPKNCGTSPNFLVCTADKKIVDPSVDVSNNRLSTSDGYSFDSAGNTIGDAQSRTFIYDGENKQVEVKDGSNNVIGDYFYDGDGKRVKKYVPATGETTVFVYDAAGKEIAEYSTIVANSTDAKVNYLTADHLGSPRINTDANGAVTARHDYMPFGEEIVSIGRRNNGGDIVRKQFTAYERDGESNLDFAQARYHDFNLGRFSSPDPENAGAQSDIAQSWNGYLYVMNNPLNSTDPTGLIWLKQKGSELWEWVDDDVYKDNPDKYRGYIKYEGQTITAVGGTAVAGDPSLKGKSVILDMNSPNVYAVPDADLERATTHFGEQALPLQNLFDGFENQGHMRFWRPVIYTTGTVVMGLFGTPVTGAITGVDYFAAAQSARIARAAQLAFNQASGAIAESQATAELALNGINIVGRRVSANVPGFGRRVMDILVEYNGQLFNIEVKSGGAVRTTAQLTKDAAMEQGATLVGRNSGELTGTVQTIKTIVYPIP